MNNKQALSSQCAKMGHCEHKGCCYCAEAEKVFASVLSQPLTQE